MKKLWLLFLPALALLLIAAAGVKDETGTTRYRSGAVISFDTSVTIKDEDGNWTFGNTQLGAAAALQKNFATTNTPSNLTNLFRRSPHLLAPTNSVTTGDVLTFNNGTNKWAAASGGDTLWGTNATSGEITNVNGGGISISDSASGPQIQIGKDLDGLLIGPLAHIGNLNPDYTNGLNIISLIQSNGPQQVGFRALVVETNAVDGGGDERLANASLSSYSQGGGKYAGVEGVVNVADGDSYFKVATQTGQDDTNVFNSFSMHDPGNQISITTDSSGTGSFLWYSYIRSAFFFKLDVGESKVWFNATNGVSVSGGSINSTNGFAKAGFTGITRTQTFYSVTSDLLTTVTNVVVVQGGIITTWTVTP